MKAIVLFALLVLAAAEEYYNTIDDYLDIQAVLADLPRMQRYMDCYMDRAPCSERTAGYKAVIPDALATNCKRCNDLQKHLANAFLSGLKALMPKEYAAFRQKFDPENKYFDNFEKAIEAY